MTQQDKELLLKDLCARLPYDPKVYVDENLPRLKLGAATRVWEYIAVDKPCKPYLRPMSSISSLISAKEWSSLSGIDLIDWYNANHIDYRGLIEKGLALVAPDNMYKIN